MKERIENLQKKIRQCVADEVERSQLILYLCDCEKECSTSKGCHLNGGGCAYTRDIIHAVNFQKTEAGSFMEKAIGHEDKNDMTDSCANELP